MFFGAVPCCCDDTPTTPTGDCVQCAFDSAPLTIDVTFENFPADSTGAFCSGGTGTCDNINGTHELSLENDGSFFTCRWTKTLVEDDYCPEETADGSLVLTVAQDGFGTGLFWTLTWTMVTGSGNIGTTFTHGTKAGTDYDCKDSLGSDLPLPTRGFTGGGYHFCALAGGLGTVQIDAVV